MNQTKSNNSTSPRGFIYNKKNAHPTNYFLLKAFKSIFFCFFLFLVLREEFRLEPQNTRVAQGDTTVFECGPPKGTPEPTIIWRKNGQKIDLENSKRFRIVDGGNLAIQDARQTDEGQYQCVVKNIVGTRESTTAILKIHGKCSFIYPSYSSNL